MQKINFKEVKIQLPEDLAETTSSKEIMEMLLNKALNKTEYYWSKSKEFEEKYKLDFISFKKRVEDSKEEVFTEWDDLVIWEGYELGYREWKKNMRS
ncbi:MAG: hypothetical protein MRJ65_10920 [Candidatus Brocadiaceae bacterium]|nr:hypothetical protein [Candidatus Brocadiaceae bacterium]